MKAEITKEGFIEIKAETVEEVFALRYLLKEYLEKGIPQPFIIDFLVLSKDGDE